MASSKQKGKEKKWLVVYLAPRQIKSFYFLFMLYNMIIINQLKKNVCIQKKLFRLTQKKKKIIESFDATRPQQFF